MKKVITIGSLLLGVIFLSGCGQQQANQTQATSNQSLATPVEKKIVANSGCGEVKDKSGITYGTVIAEDGKCWLDRNLGATEVATSSKDEASYGWYFQWGRGADGHQIPTSGTTKTKSSTDTPKHANFIFTGDYVGDWRSPSNNNLWQGVNGINNPCPVGFHVPTETEWGSLLSAANIRNDVTAFSSSLKLVLAGQRDAKDGKLALLDSFGYYWSSSSYSDPDFPTFASSLLFYSGGLTPVRNYIRAHGFSVRCIKD